MSKGQQVKLGDYCEITSSKRIFYSDYVADGVPFFRSKEIIERQNGSDISEPLFISTEKYESIKSQFGIPLVGDMLLTSVGTIGIAYIVKPDDYFYFKDGNLTWFRNFSPLLSSKYLYYWITSQKGKGILYNSTIGSSQKALTISALKKLIISLPPIEVQRKIADVLSAYDDLIENNRKQIKLLEEAAQRLYKEWFIDLRFPGHENTPEVDGLPDGWMKRCAIDFFNITIGKTPPRAENQCFTNGNSGIPWVSISDMGNCSIYISDTSEGLTPDAINKYNVKIIPVGTILLSFKLTLGRVSITTTPCCTNEAIAHFYIENEDLRPYTFLYLKSFEYDTLGNTSSISKAVNSSIIKAMPFIMPNANLVADFAKYTKPIFEKICCLQKSISEAKNARDYLLSKLMSGELEVE